MFRVPLGNGGRLAGTQVGRPVLEPNAACLFVGGLFVVDRLYRHEVCVVVKPGRIVVFKGLVFHSVGGGTVFLKKVGRRGQNGVLPINDGAVVHAA